VIHRVSRMQGRSLPQRSGAKASHLREGTANPLFFKATVPLINVTLTVAGFGHLCYTPPKLRRMQPRAP
jgi:hypothetical protein